MKKSLIILTNNEEEGLRKMIPRLKKEWVDEIVVVDWNSKDKTLDIAKKAGYKVVEQRKSGRGVGFRDGLNHSKYDILIYFSPDGNEIPEDIPKLIKKIEEGCDMVIASRFAEKSKSDDATFIRRFGNNMFTFLINLFFKTNVTDAVNGYRAITRKCMEDLNTTALHFDIEIQMTIRSAKKGYKICEIPTFEPERIDGRGRLNTVVDGSRYFRLIFKELFLGKNF